MSKWLATQQYKKILAFIGTKGSFYLLFGIFAGILVFGAELAFAYVLQMFLVVMKIIPSTSINLPSWIPADNQYLFLAFVAAILFVRGFAQWLNAYLTSSSYEIQRDQQRYRLMEWALRAKSVNTGSLITFYHQGIEAVCNVLSNIQSMTVSLSTSGLIWLFMLNLSVKTTLIATLALGLIGLFTQVFAKYINREGKEILVRMEDLNLHLLNNIKNLLLVQIYGTQDKERAVLKRKLSKILERVLKFHKIIHIKIISPQIIGFVVICGLSIAATRREWIAPPVMVTYFYLFIRFVQNFSETVKQSSTVSYSLPTAVSFAKWWAEHAHDGLRNPVKETASGSNYSIQKPVGWNIENISFSYPDSTEKIFNNFSLQIEAGKALVVLGESGSGKSTFLSILLGMTEVCDGRIEITLDNHNIPLAQVRKSLLPHIGYVGSESFLIAGTIFENLVYGLDVKPSSEQIQSALNQAGCDFIPRLKEGLNHPITEQGQGLSAGQKQRLSFARALLRNPKVLILDEATANLDRETEQNLVHTLQNLKGKATIIAVTHREALLAIADQVLDLNNR